MNDFDVASLLQVASRGLLDGANLFLAQPGLSRGLRILGGLAGLGSKLLQAGKDPVEHITRILDIDAEMNAARDMVDAEARKDADQS